MAPKNPKAPPSTPPQPKPSQAPEIQPLGQPKQFDPNAKPKFIREKKSGRTWRKWEPGMPSPNPSGRPPLSREMKILKYECLETAVELMHFKLHDPEYVNRLSPTEFVEFINTVFDRCGLPRVTQNNLAGPGGKPLSSQSSINFGKFSPEKQDALLALLDAKLAGNDGKSNPK